MERTSGRRRPKAVQKWLMLTLIAGLFIATASFVLLSVGCAGSTTPSTSAKPGDQTATPAKPTAQATVVTQAPASSDLLVETDWLAQKLSDSSIRIVDTRKADDYKAGHIKGAVNIPVEAMYAKTEDAATIVGADQLASLLGAKGIGDENRVILYDAGRQYNASRVFWTLEYYGSKKVSVLNGGFKKWRKENKEASTAEPSVPAAKFTAKVDPSRLAKLDDVRTAVGKSTSAIIDARAPAEYNGDAAYAKRNGHIPGAVNVDWVNLFAADDTFKPAAGLAKLYADKGVTKDKDVYIHCQVGLRSAASYLSLRVLGYDKVHHYVASWQEWGNDPNTPIEK